MDTFAAAHANDRSLMVSRLYNPAELLQKLEDLQRIPLTFTAAEGFDSLRRYFISDDEINQALRGHESEFRSRLDVFSFFIRNTNAKEREKFLKRQHGEYSGYHGGNDNRVYDSTGFFSATGVSVRLCSGKHEMASRYQMGIQHDLRRRLPVSQRYG